MRTDANGCAWVWMGALDRREHGGYKNKASGGIHGRADQDLNPMIGEISPNIMFWGISQKTIWMGTGGYRAVQMGANECINKERGKNKEKRVPNGRAGHVFGRMLHAKKCVMLAKMIVVLREGQGEEQRANKARALRFNVFKQRKNSKTNGKPKEKGKTRTHKYGNPRPQMQ